MKTPLFAINEIVFYYNKWENQIQQGQIINLRSSNLNWDYNIRYEIYNDMHYTQWIEEKYIGKDEQVLFRFLI